jgi:hypothetical protein
MKTPTAKQKARANLPEWRLAVKTLTFLKTVTGVDVKSTNRLLRKYKARVTRAQNILKS